VGYGTASAAGVKSEQAASVIPYTGNFGFVIFLIFILIIFGMGLFGPGCW
jgi:hypothetical protein